MLHFPKTTLQSGLSNTIQYNTSKIVIYNQPIQLINVFNDFILKYIQQQLLINLIKFVEQLRKCSKIFTGIKKILKVMVVLIVVYVLLDGC